MLWIVPPTTTPGGKPVTAVPGRLTDADERDRLLEVASRGGERVLTYHHDSFDRDVAAARKGLTPEFAEEYELGAGAMAQIVSR